MPFVGINSTGPEKGAIPGSYGVDYWFDSQETLGYLASLGCKNIRAMVRWERVQPVLGGALDSTELQRLKDFVFRAGFAGLKVDLTINKGGRHNELAIGEVGGPTQANFVDLWDRISDEFKDNLNVRSYGNNEPHDFPDSFTAFTNVATFDATAEGWTTEGGSGVTTTRITTNVHDGAGALQCVKTVLGGVFQSLRVTDNIVATHNESANGSDYACWLWCPAGETGWSARIDITDSTGANISGNSSTLTPNQWNYVNSTFTSAQVSEMQRKIVQIHNSSPTAGSKTFVIDSIVQAVRLTGRGRWELADAAAVAAVRGNGDGKLWRAAGYGWSAADGWAARHPLPWHTDLSIVYEAHLYYDNDHSGTYASSFITETTNAVGQGFSSIKDRALSWLGNFLGWGVTYGVPLILGETGWPDTDSEAWNDVGAAVLAAAWGAGASVHIWAVGEIEGTGYTLTPWQASGGNFTPVNSANIQAPIIQPYFNLELLPIYTPSADPWINNRPRIVVRDLNEVPLGQIGDFLEADFYPRWNGFGAWRIKMSSRQAGANLWRAGAGIMAVMPDDFLFTGQVTSIRRLKGSEDRGGTIEVSGVEDTAILGFYLAYPVPTQDIVNQTASSVYNLSAPAETVAWTITRLNLSPAASVARRRIANLRMEPNGGRGPVTPVSLRYDNILAVHQRILSPNGLGFSIKAEPGGYVYSVFESRDLSKDVVFTEDNGTLSSWDFNLTAPSIDLAVVAGQGEGTARNMRPVSNPINPKATWGWYMEQFIDRRDTNVAAELDQAAAEAFAQGSEMNSLALAVKDFGQFNSLYRLGDKIGAKIEGVVVSDIISEARYEFRPGSYRVTPIVGNAEAVGGRALDIYRVVRQIAARVGLLEKRF